MNELENKLGCTFDNHQVHFINIHELPKDITIFEKKYDTFTNYRHVKFRFNKREDYEKWILTKAK